MMNETSGPLFRKATKTDAQVIVELLDELLKEIMGAAGTQAFDFDFMKSTERAGNFMDREKCFVFLAIDGEGRPAGFIAFYESYALYAGGVFGTISEFYVRPADRSKKLGLGLLSMAKAFGTSRGWSRLEVTTPPLPQFDRTLAFYERENFSITGGRKLKLAL